MALEHRGSFSARSASGIVFTIDIFANVITSRLLNGTVSRIDGLKELRTTNGQHVNRIDKGKYHIVESGIDLTSDDPNAP